MTFIIKYRGSPTATTYADYECPVHGRFEAQVERTAEGDAPDRIECPLPFDEGCDDTCGAPSEWRISAPLARVNPIEAVKGGWAKPERKTWMDTRELGEGQSLEEFRAKREAIREEQRKEDVMRFARAHHTNLIGKDV